MAGFISGLKLSLIKYGGFYFSILVIDGSHCICIAEYNGGIKNSVLGC